MIHLGAGICHPWQNAEVYGASGVPWTGVDKWFPDCAVYDYKWGRVGSPNYVPMVFDPLNQNPPPGVVETRQGGLWLWGNEPDEPFQGTMSVGDAVEAWKFWRRRTKPKGIATIAPNIQINTPSGIEWLTHWAERVADDPPDVWGIHIYWTDTAESWLNAWNQFKHNWHRKHGRIAPVVVTETNAFRDKYDGETIQLQLAAVQTMRNDPLLCGVFWFATHYPGWEYSNLFDGSDQLTSTGRAWKRFAEHAGNVYLPNVSRG